MDLSLDEHKLVAEFRRLNPAGKQELLDYAGFLAKKMAAGATETPAVPANQCRLEAGEEERPEAAEVPIFTE